MKRQTAATVLAMLVTATIAGCSSPGNASGGAGGGGESGQGGSGSTPRSTVPPPPSASPGQRAVAPVVWIGGTLIRVGAGRIRVREQGGPTLSMTQLVEGATPFYRSSGNEWRRLASGAALTTGGPACVETLMDGRNLLALRVFLGTGCGPG